MNKLKIYTILLAIMTTVAWFSVVAQTTDSAAMTTTTTSTETERPMSNDASTDHKADNPYAWIAIGAFAVIAAGAGIYFVRKSKKGDDRPQSGSDINNPASGI